jgi:HD-GYP domain-containing protein (c-di-GMP phosphodiesterase class II)
MDQEWPIYPDDKDLQIVYRHDLLLVAGGALGLRHPETAGHSERMESYARVIAKPLRLLDEDRDTLCEACLLHDLGKIAFEKELLEKPELTDDDWEIVKQHPVGSEAVLVKLTSIPATTKDIVRHHHEKLDGSGYPDGLEDNQIKKLVRIITVLDEYDAMTSRRAHREKNKKDGSLTPQQAFKALNNEASSKKLDKDIVEQIILALKRVYFI